MPTFKIELAGNPNSCIIKIGKRKYRALLDSGAEVSLIHTRVYNNLGEKPKLHKQGALLQSVKGDSIDVDGCTWLKYEIGREKQEHEFYVVSEMNRNIILGRDWLKQFAVRMYYDLGCLRVGKSYIKMEEDIHISSLIRLKSKTQLKPQSGKLCWGRIKGNPQILKAKLHQVMSIENNNEPGLLTINAIVKLTKKGICPIFIVNSTNHTISLKKGSTIGKIEQLQECSIVDIRQLPPASQQLPTSLTKDLIKHITTPNHQNLVAKLIEQSADLFAEKDTELGRTSTLEMNINTDDHPPIKLKPYRTPFAKRQIVSKAVDEMLKADIIRPSKSPWCFPVVVVTKKDGSYRFCTDFRKLNIISKKTSWPLPVIDDMLAVLGKSKFFTTLDLKSGYWQIPLKEEDKEKTAFGCHRGLFEYNVLPFGLSNGPSIFQQLMSIVLQDFGDFCMAYLDDIIIFSPTLDDHTKHIQMVFDRLRVHGLKLKLSKCKFMQRQTQYLGFIINEEGIMTDPEKVRVIKEMIAPTTVKGVRSFIGMCSYYRRFIPKFSEIAKPLIRLTKKFTKFEWTQDCQTAFDLLKRCLVTAPVLAYPDINKPYILYTDASDGCIGACLTQNLIDGEKPIYYLSHKLTKSQNNWPTIEKEAFAIFYALQKLDQYLHDSEFVIRTDHKPLKSLLETTIENKKIQYWTTNIRGYNCKIEYIEGKKNVCADMLSRLEPICKDDDCELSGPDITDKTFEIGVIDSSQVSLKQFAQYDQPLPDKQCLKEELRVPGYDMITEQNKDQAIVTIKKNLENEKTSPSVLNKYIILDQVLYYLSNVDSDPVIRLYIPEHLRDQVIKQYHDMNGHMGIDKTHDAIKGKYFWPNMYKELYQYVHSCIICQTRNLKKIKPPQQETDAPPYPFAKIGLDVSGPYPKTLSGNKYIIGFVDWYSGWPEAFAVPDKTAETVAHLVIDEIIPRHSTPLQIVSDNGSENVNKVMKHMLKSNNISHITTSFYHPQGNSKVERFHRTLHDIMSKKVNDNLETWDIYLNQVLGAIRFNINDSTKFSPFYLLYNRDPVLPIDNILKPRRKYLGEEPHKIGLEQQHKAFVLVHKHLKKAKKRQAKYANENSQYTEFQVGDPVYLKQQQRRSKLQGRWCPYYRIIEKTTPITFRIKNQLDGTVTKAHAEHIRLAHLSEWKLPKDIKGRPLRKVQNVVPQSSSDDESSDEEPHFTKILKRSRKERETSSDEDDVPLMELAKKLREQSPSQNDPEQIKMRYVKLPLLGKLAMIQRLETYCKLL